jgi:hypothetical protein
LPVKLALSTGFGKPGGRVSSDNVGRRVGGALAKGRAAPQDCHKKALEETIRMWFVDAWMLALALFLECYARAPLIGDDAEL